MSSRSTSNLPVTYILELNHLGQVFEIRDSADIATEEFLDSIVKENFFRHARGTKYEIRDAAQTPYRFHEIMRWFQLPPSDINVEEEVLRLKVVRRNHEEEDWNNTVLKPRESKRPPSGNVEKPDDDVGKILEIGTAFQEFVDNAIQYTCGRIANPVANPTVAISLEGATSGRITFLDNGSGIPYTEVSRWSTLAGKVEVVPRARWDTKLVSKMLKKPTHNFVGFRVYLARDDPSSFNRIHSPNHLDHINILNWYGLGSKLAASNLGGQNCCLELRSKSRIGSSSFATLEPGNFRSWKHGELLPEQIPTGAADFNSFTQVSLLDANVTELLESRPMADFCKALRGELANVYFVFLVGHEVVGERLQQLNKLKPAESFGETPPPSEPLAPNTHAVTIKVNDQEIDLQSSFVFRCLSEARSAFSFRVQFGKSKGALTSEAVEYEASIHLLYFSVHSGGPPKMSDTDALHNSHEKKTLVFWNGKFMLLDKTDIFEYFNFPGRMDAEILKNNVRALVFFSRSFHPKTNKESIDDHDAIQTLQKIIQEDGSISECLAKFLRECRDADSRSDWKYDDAGRIIGVNVAMPASQDGGKKKFDGIIYFPSVDLPTYTITYSVGGKKANIYDCFVSIHGKPEQMLIDLHTPSLDGTILRDGITFKVTTISPAHILSATLQPKQKENFRAYRLCVPHSVKIGGRELHDKVEINEETTLSIQLRGPDPEIGPQIKQVGKVLNPFSLTHDVQDHKTRLSTFRGTKHTEPIRMRVKPFGPTGWDGKQGEYLSWNQEKQCWTWDAEKWVYSAQVKEWSFFLVPEPLDDGTKPGWLDPLCALLSRSPVKVVVPPSEPSKLSTIRCPSTAVQLGVPFQVEIDAKDKYAFPAVCDPKLWSISASHFACVFETSHPFSGPVCFNITLSGRATSLNSKISISYKNVSVPPFDVSVEFGPAVRMAATLSDQTNLVNGKVASLKVDAFDISDNPTQLPESIQLEGDLVLRPQLLTPMGATDKTTFSIDSALFVQPASSDQSLSPSIAADDIDKKLSFLSVKDSAKYYLWTHVSETKVYIGDTLHVKAGTTKHMFTIHSIFSGPNANNVRLRGPYYFAEGCYQSESAQLDPSEVIMSDEDFEYAQEKLQLLSRINILSESEFKDLPIPPSHVRFCKKAIIERKTFELVTSSHLLQASPASSVTIKVLLGNKFCDSIDLNPSDHTPLLSHIKFAALVAKHTLSLYAAHETLLTTLAATYNQRLVSNSTKISELNLNSRVPLIVCPLRNCWDQYNSSLRLYAPKISRSPPGFLIYEARVTVRPGAKACAIDLSESSFGSADPLSRCVVEWNFSVTELKAPKDTAISATFFVLDESGQIYKGPGRVAFANHRYDDCVLNHDNSRTFKFKMPDEKNANLDFVPTINGKHRPEDQLTQTIAIKNIRGPPQTARVKAVAKIVGAPLRLQVSVLDRSDTPLVLTTNSYAFQWTLQAQSDMFGSESTEMVDVAFSANVQGAHILITTANPIICKAGSPYKITLTGTEGGFPLHIEMESTVDVQKSNNVHRLESSLANIDMKSFQLLPPLHIGVYDEGGNEVKLQAKDVVVEVQNIVFSPPIKLDLSKSGIRFQEGSQAKPVRQGQGHLKFVVKDKSLMLPICVGAGAAPTSIEAYFKKNRSMALTVAAGDEVSEAAIAVTVRDECGDLSDIPLNVLVVETPGSAYETGLNAIFQDRMFRRPCVYNLRIQAQDKSLKLELQNPLLLTVTRGPVSQVHIRNWPTAQLQPGASFQVSGILMNKFNSVWDSKVKFWLVPDDKRFCLICSDDGLPWIYADNGQFDRQVQIEVSEDATFDEAPGSVIQFDVRANFASTQPQQPLVLVGTLSVLLGRQNTLQIAAPPRSSADAARKSEMEAEAALLRKKVLQIEDWIAQINLNDACQYRQDNIASVVCGDPVDQHILALPAGHVFHLELPETIFEEIRKQPTAEQQSLLQKARIGVSRKMGSLSNIVFCVENFSQQDLDALSDRYDQRATQKRVTYDFLTARKGARPRSNLQELVDMIIPDKKFDAWEDLLQGWLSIQCPLVSVVLRASDVAPLRQRSRASKLQIFCIENQKTYTFLQGFRSDSREVENNGNYTGPLIRLLPPQAYNQKLQAELADAQSQLVGLPSAAKRTKTSE